MPRLNSLDRIRQVQPCLRNQRAMVSRRNCCDRPGDAILPGQFGPPGQQEPCECPADIPHPNECKLQLHTQISVRPAYSVVEMPSIEYGGNRRKTGRCWLKRA